MHCNDVNDSRYLEFLEPLYSQLQTRLAPESEGMDFGCGPGPALASLFRRAGHHVTLYDPFYHPDKNALDKQYDFISASEVFEHLYNPATEIQKLRRLLKPRGWLGVMTQLVDEQTDFANWYYRRDPTHVVFFSLRSFAWIAHGFGFSEPIHCGPRVVLLQTR